MGYWPTDALNSLVAAALFQSSATFSVTITTPAASGTVTQVDFSIVWTFASGTQSTYRVEILDTGGTLQYDSGIVSSSIKSHTMPTTHGLTNGTDYDIRVTAVTTASQTGQSSLHRFTTAYAPVNDVTGLTVTANNNALPRIALTWSAFVLSGSEVFSRYNVYRRKSGTSTWTRLAGNSLTNRTGDLSYDDYNVNSGTTWEYAVTATVTDGGNTLESDKQTSSNTASLAFDPIYLHKESDTSAYIEVKADQVDITQGQDVQFLRVWNRKTPTVHVGKLHAAQITLSGLQGWDDNSALWTTIFGYVDDQHSAGTVFVLRHRDERFFVAIVQHSRNDQPADIYRHTLELQEIYFDETEAAT